MDREIIIVYCLCVDTLAAMNHSENRQCQVSDAEIMTIGIVAALYFGGNYTLAREMLKEQGYIPGMVGKSRFSRRLHRVQHHFLTVFNVLAELWKAETEEDVYLIDTYPIAACDNIRISRCKLYQSEEYRGYKASKKRYFYGLSIHMMVTKEGQPVEFFLTCGAFSDTSGLELFDFDLPEGSLVVGDKAYNYYLIEDLLDDCHIQLRPIRKKNSTRPLPPWMQYLQSVYRQSVETAGSMIERLLPKSIHATSTPSFELKVVLFCLASSFSWLFQS
ncbi:IS982 family transposase [Chloroflexi bacterium TSY]|nr:IS982 family transposase [Chloroflexi bacterium TSY]